MDLKKEIHNIFSMNNYFTTTHNSQKVFCPLCDRIISENVPKSIHHLIPKSKGGKGGKTVLLHHICHKQIHLMFKEKELAKSLYKIEDLKKHPRLKKFIEWVKKRPPEFLSKTHKLNKNRSKDY